MVEAELLSIVLNFVLGVLVVVFGKEYRKFKKGFIATARAIEDDSVTWKEAKEILESVK